MCTSDLLLSVRPVRGDVKGCEYLEKDDLTWMDKVLRFGGRGPAMLLFY